jgi:recombination protein RecA
MELTRRKKVVDQIEDEANTTSGDEEKINKELLIPTGSSLLNLACSDSVNGAFAVGGIANIIGDSQAGKSLLALSILAEVCHHPQFHDHRIIYDDVEEANSFDMIALFGKTMTEKLEAPNYIDEVPHYSDTIQDFHMNINRAIKEDSPFVYILDSFDALTSDEEINKVEANLEAREKGKEGKGSYGMDKPKAMSQMLRMIKGKIKKTNSLLLIISQTRDDINPMTFTTKTRSGGNALRFYSWHEMWLAVAGKIPGKHEIPIGVNIKIKVSKNKLTGKLREIKFPIYYSYGIEDVESMIDWLVDHKFWQKSGNSIIPEGLSSKTAGEKFTKKHLIDWIGQHSMENKLRELVAQYWQLIEKEARIDRKKKYE